MVRDFPAQKFFKSPASGRIIDTTPPIKGLSSLLLDLFCGSENWWLIWLLVKSNVGLRQLVLGISNRFAPTITIAIVHELFSKFVEPSIVLHKQWVGLIGDILEVISFHLVLLVFLHLTVRVLLLTQLHWVDRVRLICLHSQDREWCANKDDFSESVNLKFDFVS